MNLNWNLEMGVGGVKMNETLVLRGGVMEWEMGGKFGAFW